MGSDSREVKEGTVRNSYILSAMKGTGLNYVQLLEKERERIGQLKHFPYLNETDINRLVNKLLKSKI